MERIPGGSQEHDLPQEAGPLADWIDEELGDEELAQFLREHPEGMELTRQGTTILPRTMFELVDDLGQVNPLEARAIVRQMDESGMLIEPSGDRFIGNLLVGEQAELRPLKRAWVASTERLGLVEGEKEKSGFERVMIEHANVAVDQLRERFGLPPFRVPPEAVRIVDKIPREKPDVLGVFAQYGQQAEILDDLHPMQRLEVTIHEMTHFKSYGAVMAQRDSEGMVHEMTYRTGMNIYSRDGKKRYLTGLNEAVTEETANRLLMEVPDDHPVLGILAREHRRIIKKIGEQNAAHLASTQLRPHWFIPTNDINDEGKQRYIYSYTKERVHMQQLFDRLIEHNPERFEGKTNEEAREELFTMLQKAMFTGNILPFGRLFNDTFGHGKFREYGHLQTVEEQQAFIAAL